MKLRVGVLQLDVALGDREKNRKNVEKWMASVSVPSDIPTAVVIPEIWDVGYALDRAAELADRIHAHPELGEQEFETSRLLAERLREGGFQVEAPTCGLPTAFQGVARHGSGPVVALLTEMDALPEIGHGCGHNLHGTASVFAALALKEALREEDA